MTFLYCPLGDTHAHVLPDQSNLEQIRLIIAQEMERLCARMERLEKTVEQIQSRYA